MTDIAMLQTRLMPVELEMLSQESVEAVERLRPARDAAITALRQAEEAARVAPSLVWSAPDPAEWSAGEPIEESEPERQMTREERLEEQYMIRMCWRRSTMTDEQKRRVRKRHGIQFYRSLRW